MVRFDLLEADARRSLERVPVDRLADRTVMVAGASGIVGTHLLYGLLQCQRDYRISTKIYALVRQGIPDHLQPLAQSGQVQFLEGDLTEHSYLNGLPRADVIVHAATYGQPGRFLAEPIRTLKLNTTGTMGLLDKLRPDGHFLFISTSELYSGLTSSPFNEDQIGCSNTNHPRSCYIEAKRCGEAICHAARQAGVNAKSARLCLAYGPGTLAGDKRVINSFIERGLREKKIQLLDCGDARRTYCYVADATYMLWRILLEGTEAIYNVGGVSNTTIADLAKLIGHSLDVPVIIPDPSKGGMAGAPADTELDLTKVQKQFGPIQFTDLSTGLAATIEWQKALYTS